MKWYLGVWKKYAVFTGRAGRREFWMFTLVNFLIVLAMEIPVLSAISSGDSSSGLFAGPYLIYGVAVFLPSMAVAVRRLHDTGHSGLWLLIDFVPFVGAIILLVLLANEGQPGPNQYGPRPLEDAVAAGVPAADAPVGAPAAWLRDPTGRHELRYWDSRQWTEHVSDAGTASTDML